MISMLHDVTVDIKVLMIQNVIGSTVSSTIYKPCKHSKMASSSFVARTGLLRYMSIPIAKKRSLSPETAFAVKATILISRTAGLA